MSFLGSRFFQLRVNYWSCSKFADKIRGVDKLRAASSEGWKEWHKTAKEKHPIRYWIAEEGLDIIQDIVYIPYDIYKTIQSYIRNRFIDKTNSLTASSTDIPPGQYADLDSRIVFCMFNEVQKFVEHNREQIEFSLNLKGKENKNQVKHAKELMKIYKWWTEDYRNRPDPYDASGFGAFYEKHESVLDALTSDKSEELKVALDNINEIEKRYYDEDTKMLISLIKIRSNLW